MERRAHKSIQTHVFKTINLYSRNMSMVFQFDWNRICSTTSVSDPGSSHFEGYTANLAFYVGYGHWKSKRNVKLSNVYGILAIMWKFAILHKVFSMFSIIMLIVRLFWYLWIWWVLTRLTSNCCSLILVGRPPYMLTSSLILRSHKF